MSKVIIGSIALAYHLPSVRAPNDYDIVCNYETMRKTLKNQKVKSTYPINSGEKQVAFLVDGRIFEIEIAWPESLSEEFIKLVEQDSSTIIYEDGNLLPS